MCKRPFFFIFLFGLLFTLYFFVFSTVTHLDKPSSLSLDHYQCISKTVESDVLHEIALSESYNSISNVNSNHQNKKIAVMENQHGEELIHEYKKNNYEKESNSLVGTNHVDEVNESEELDDMNNSTQMNSESVERDVNGELKDEKVNETAISSSSPPISSSSSSSSPVTTSTNTDTNDDDILLEFADEPETHQPHNTTNSAYYKTIKSKLIRKHRNRFGRMKKWNATLSDFIKRHQKANNPRGTIFYIKRGTTGISGQLIGICDSYYIAVTTGKFLQFTSSVVTDTYFSFGIPNLFYPLNDTDQERVYSSRPPAFNTSWDTILTAVATPDPLSKPVRSLKKYHHILFSTLHVTADRFFKERANRDVMEKMGILSSKLSPAPEGRSELYNMVDFYYGRCIKSLFHPSPQLQPILDHYEKLLGDGLRIGIHIRMGNGMSDWKDSHTFLDHSKVNQLIHRLREMIQSIERKYPELPIHIFLSTDSSTEEEIMKNAFPSYIVTTDGLRSHVGGIYNSHFDDLSIQKAILDQMLLGKCDLLFLTMRSGFSRIGLYYAPEGTPYKYI